MAGEADQILLAINEPAIGENKSASGVESDDLVASSSSKAATVKMVNKTTPMMYDYWKKSTITKADHSTFHAAGWLGG
jgi:hypothetical protein